MSRPERHRAVLHRDSVPVALAFYRDRLGFEITFQVILVKSVGVQPIPNCAREIKQGIARWDAYVHGGDGLRGFELKDAAGSSCFSAARSLDAPAPA